MTGDVYDLLGPFSESVRGFEVSQLASFGVRIKTDREAPHPLNPVRQLKYVAFSPLTWDGESKLGPIAHENVLYGHQSSSIMATECEGTKDVQVLRDTNAADLVSNISGFN